VFCGTKCVVGICEIGACSKIFGQNTKSVIILSTANSFVLVVWIFSFK